VFGSKYDVGSYSGTVSIRHVVQVFNLSLQPVHMVAIPVCLCTSVNIRELDIPPFQVAKVLISVLPRRERGRYDERVGLCFEQKANSWISWVTVKYEVWGR
jgi:hypothetical protein